MTNFKYVGLSAVLLLGSPALADGPAFAGGTDAPVLPVTQIAPAATNDWSGFYAGGLVSLDSSDDIEITTNAAITGVRPTDSNTSYGGFAGYNFQYGAIVYGGELAVSTGGIHSITEPNIHYETVYDLKARAGYNFGNVLVYGVVGNSFSNLDWSVILQAPSSGLSYGAGIDYRIGEHMFVGFEYLTRDLSGDTTLSTADLTQTATITIQSAQLRVGWQF